MTFYSIVRLRDGGGRTGGRVVGTGSGCVQRRSGSSPAFGRRSVGVPARVWAVASGEATAFRAVIGLEVTGRRMVAVCRLCRRRRRRKDWRTGCGCRERLRAAEVGSSPAFGRGSGSGLGRGSVPNCRTEGKRLRDARSKAGWRREWSTREVAGWADGPRQKGERRRRVGDGYNEKTHRRMTVGFLSDRLCLIRLRLPRT